MIDHKSYLPRRIGLGSTKFIDVTLRDGGFATDFIWSKDFIPNYIRLIQSTSASHAELGYLGGVPDNHFSSSESPTTNLTPSYVSTLKSYLYSHSRMKFSAVLHPACFKENSSYLHELKDSGLDLIRVIYHSSWHEQFIRLTKQIHECGIPLSINVALASRYKNNELIETCNVLARLQPAIIYIADTIGAMTPKEVAMLFDSINGLSCDKGIHAHNSLSFALSNSLNAVENGASYVDGSLGGIGRGGGNLRTEQWLILNKAITVPEISVIKNAFDLVCNEVNSNIRPDFYETICGAFNLTPVQEVALRNKQLSLKEILQGGCDGAL